MFILCVALILESDHTVRFYFIGFGLLFYVWKYVVRYDVVDYLELLKLCCSGSVLRYCFSLGFSEYCSRFLFQ